MCEIKTHLRINKALCGECIDLKEGESKVRLTASEDMVADEKGLVHGGFIFGLADYACMIAINHPNVVLAKAEVKFIKPVKIGDTMISHAKIQKTEDNKYTVQAYVNVGDTKVFEGVFLCVIPSKHVLD